MSDDLTSLYAARDYPPMSHPATHPAVTGVAARVAGLAAVVPARARVLDLGCSSGWNLLPMAADYPAMQGHGIDFAARAIHTAREMAAAAGIGNAQFEQADLCEWRGGGGFDFVIAHGLYSWVEPPVRVALLELCHRELAPTGVACISFQVRAGNLLRRQVVDLVRALAARTGDDPVAPLATLEMLEKVELPRTPHAAHVRWLIGDLRAKGRGMLPFDDFAPQCEPFSLGEFAVAAETAGLRVLGASEISANLPLGADAGALDAIGDPWLLQETLDLLAGRSFRLVIVCRADAPVAELTNTAAVLDLAARLKSNVAVRHDGLDLLDEAGVVQAATSDPVAVAVFRRLSEAAPACRPVVDLLENLPGGKAALPAAAGLLFDAARAGWVELRTAPVAIDTAPCRRPLLDRLRREAVRRRWPLVDAYHRPCSFGEEHYRILTACDGTRSLEEVAALAVVHAPALAFGSWFGHLRERGLVGDAAGE